MVLEAVQELRSHVTAAEVYERIAKNHPQISRATVYRNLNVLAELGEIRRIETPNSADRFDHIRQEHYHARCVRCGRLFDVKMDFIRDLEQSVEDAFGFEITGHDIFFKGVCMECKVNPETSRGQ
jgi:Fur family ferric uptake transcriptional regulator/Fur family peroxide stress response transcriptional regulator